MPLDAEFFGRKIRSPFLLSAAPHTDGYAQMRKAYERGWSGGVMKTAFDNVPIHIPSEYMSVIGPSTYGNCDNVSGHPLDRVCGEVERLIKEFPDRLTLASTGGPVTGRDEADKAVWQSNTRKLESAGAMGVEYSLSCPQGGDGTEGDIVSQNAELAAKIIDWVMEASSEDNPKLFKLTAAVTSIQPIIKRDPAGLREVSQQAGRRHAGEQFPLAGPAQGGEPALGGGRRRRHVRRRRAADQQPDAGQGLRHGHRRVRQRRADELQGRRQLPGLGAQTVQFCTIVMKYGLGIVDELHSGLSFLMEERGFKSVKELIGSALPNPITDFMALSATKKLPQVDGRAVRALRQLHALPVPGHHAEREEGADALTRRSASAVRSARRSVSPAPSPCARAPPASWPRSSTSPCNLVTLVTM